MRRQRWALLGFGGVAIALLLLFGATLTSAWAQGEPPDTQVPTVSVPPPNPCTTPVPGQPRPPYCLPDPTAPTVEPTDEPTPRTPGQPDDEDDQQDEDEPGGVVGWIIDGIDQAITSFFRNLVTAGLRPTLELVGRSLLTTPTLDQLPRIGELWESSRLLVLASYGVLIMIGGLVVMSHESIQTRYSIKEIGPRLVVGFLAANLSLPVIDLAIQLANALSVAVLGDSVDPDNAAEVMTDLVYASLSSGGLWLLLIGLAIQVVSYALLITWIVRVAATVVLIVAAPLALACLGLPQTEAIARWWWRAFGALLAIQVLQALTLATMINVFYGEGGFSTFGSAGDALINLLVTLALLYILCKIPFWLWQHVQFGGQRRSVIGRMAKAFIAYKTFGLLRGLRGAGGGGAAGPRRGPPGPGPTPVQPRPPHGGRGGRPTAGPTPVRPRPTGPRPLQRRQRTAPVDDLADQPASTVPGAGRRPHHAADRTAQPPPPRPARTPSSATPRTPAQRPAARRSTPSTTRPVPSRPPTARVRPLPPDLHTGRSTRPSTTAKDDQ